MRTLEGQHYLFKSFLAFFRLIDYNNYMKTRNAKNQTSFYEQAVFYYISQFFHDAGNRIVIGNNNEADIFIPEIHCVVEYDGLYWHESKMDRDNEKNLYFNSVGLRVIRIRDIGLPDLEPFDGKVFYHKRTYGDNGYHIYEIIEQLIRGLAEFTSDQILTKKLLKFTLNKNMFLSDAPDINAVLHPNQVENSIMACSGIEDWDYEKNKRLKPTNITLSYRQKCFFRCKKGESKLFYPSLWLLKDGQDQKPYRNYCAGLLICDDHCQVKEKLLSSYFNGDFTISDDEIPMYRKMLANSKSTRFCIELLFSRIGNSGFVDRFERLFIIQNGIPIFLGQTMHWPDSSGDIELIKQLYQSYPGLVLNISAAPFDITNKQRKVFFQYYEWMIQSLKNKNEYYLIASCFRRSISDGIAEERLSNCFVLMVIRFINRHKDVFKHEDKFISWLNDYLAKINHD